MNEAPRNAPIPFLTLPNWLTAAAQCGFNVEPLLREAGIEPDLIHLDSASVRPQQLLQLMEACVARARGRHFPFVLGETFAFDYLPEIATFLNTSSTLREALRVFEWVREFINPALEVRLELREGRAWLLLEASTEAGEIHPWFVESTFAAILKFARSLVAEGARFERLRLRYPAPAYADEYREFFGTAVDFGQAENALVFEPALLDRPLEGAFPALHKQAEYLVEQRRTRLPRRRGGLVQEIDEAFAAQPVLLRGGLEDLAAALSLHARTLQRRLREEGQSYAELQTGARFRAAAAWLRDAQTDIETVSERLGFSDRRSFTRAFTRWAGMSPSAFRKKNI